MHIQKLRRIFEIIEKLLSSYMHPALKKNHYFTVKELEMFIELGHSSSDFHNLLKERGIQRDQLPGNTTPPVVEVETGQGISLEMLRSLDTDDSRKLPQIETL
jgi:hypothetical protein